MSERAHPYVGIPAKVNNPHNHAHGLTGIIVAVVGDVATLLLDDGQHEMSCIGALIVDAAEAKRRMLEGAK